MVDLFLIKFNFTLDSTVSFTVFFSLFNKLSGGRRKFSRTPTVIAGLTQPASKLVVSLLIARRSRTLFVSEVGGRVKLRSQRRTAPY